MRQKERKMKKKDWKTKIENKTITYSGNQMKCNKTIKMKFK